MNAPLSTSFFLIGILSCLVGGCVEPIETSTASCPCADGWRCCGNNICAKIGEPCSTYCGDGTIDAGEFCDHGENNQDSYQHNPTCNTRCDGYGPHCGDGEIQQGGTETGGYEGCDPGTADAPVQALTCSTLDPELGTGNASCNSDCTSYDTSNCEIQNLIHVAEGPFLMGCNEAIDSDCNPSFTVNHQTEELPYHAIDLDAFVMTKHEITAGMYKECVDASACEYNGSATEAARTYNNDRDLHPINMVNWEEAQAYCAWRNMQLPTEAQWEKAARGVGGRIYPWGNELANCQYAILTNHTGEGCGLDGTWEVGSKIRGTSPYGAMDMAGNVFEWTQDWFQHDYYEESPPENPQGPETGAAKVMRGGSWYNSDYRLVRASNRLKIPPSTRTSILGFRCVR